MTRNREQFIYHPEIVNLHDAMLLFSVALVAGALNSVAGGGSFLSFPALVLTGVPPIQANATNTAALWPGTVASAGAYRDDFRRDDRKVILPLMITGMTGAVLGATVLLHTPQATFLRLIPYLLGGATLLFAASGRITHWIRQRSAHMRNRTKLAVAGAALIQLCIAVYIGFFGAGAGILMLAMLAIMGIESIHTMNAYKTVLASLCNGIASGTVLPGARDLLAAGAADAGCGRDRRIFWCVLRAEDESCTCEMDGDCDWGEHVGVFLLEAGILENNRRSGNRRTEGPLTRPSRRASKGVLRRRRSSA